MTKDNDNMPEDEKLSAIYKDAGQDLPPSQLDDKILAAARRETSSRPHPAFSPFSSNWRVPVSLAAVLVLSIGIVNLMDDEVMPEIDGSGVLLSDLNDLPAAAVEEGEVLQSEAEPAGALSLTEKKQPSFRQKQPRRDKADTDGFGLRQPAAKPAVKSPETVTSVDKSEQAPAEQDKGLLDRRLQKKKARKEARANESDKQSFESADRMSPMSETVTNAASSKTQKTISTVTAIPTVSDITKLRKAGKIDDANKAADVFIQHHFGDDLDKVNPAQVKLHIRHWFGIVIELRELGRKQQASQLEKLAYGRRDLNIRR